MKTNKLAVDRIRAILAALDAHDHVKNADMLEEMHETRIIDMLADLRHYCVSRQFDFDDLNKVAEGHFRYERGECVGGKHGTHPKVAHGQCDVCGHYGDDCTGTTREEITS